ncbi:MAG: hypothetical protein BECKG1743D_GA0114223_103331, partial [Candidatus Kentron sp. G]
MLNSGYRRYVLTFGNLISVYYYFNLFNRHLFASPRWYRNLSAAVLVQLRLSVTARVISGVASHIQVEETEALHVSRIALMVRGY